MLAERPGVNMPQNNNPLKRLWRWAKDQVVQDVSEDSALCAFDCQKGQCTQDEWEACERRLHKAAGELMPADAEPVKERTEHVSPDAETTPTRVL